MTKGIFPVVLVAATLVALIPVHEPARAATPLALHEVGTGLNLPVFVTAAPGDSTRLFVVCKDGTIRILEHDSVLTRPFLDITDRVGANSSERGLLGLAFHPDYPMNGYLYVNYTDQNGNTHIARFTASSDPDSAVAASEYTILGPITQPYANHNAGMLAFGPNDGYLYFGLGDGGSGGDPGNRAQNPTLFLGKMLRIDVDGGAPYAIPPDNPFVGTVDTLPEIWAIGYRNPWRWSFDPANGAMYVGDVGQSALEEIDYEPPDFAGGANYGWRLMEGTNCYDPPTGCDTLTGLTDPIQEYPHSGSPTRCAITGGVVYRGCAIPDLDGTYFFADFCSGEIFTFRYDGTNLTDSTDRTAELGLPLGTPVCSFGQDNQGEVYVVDFNGHVYRVVPDGVPSACSGQCCMGITGNADDDPSDDVNISDLTYLVTYLFGGGPQPVCLEEGNVDGSIGEGSQINVADITYLVSYIFIGGPSPVPCPTVTSP